MKLPKKIITLIPIFLFLTACATVQRQPLTTKERAQIKSDKILLNTTQRKMVMQKNNWLDYNDPDKYLPMDSGAIVHQNAGAAPPGLLGALIVAGIDKHEADKSAREMVAVNAALGNFDYVALLNREVKSKVATIPWLKVRQQEIRYNISKTAAHLLLQAKENTTLFIGTTYALDSIFKQLEVVVYVKLSERPGKKQSPRTLYANNFYFIYRLKTTDTNKDMNKRLWIKDDAGLLKEKLKDAASILSNLIAKDLQNPSPVPYKHIKRMVSVRGVDGRILTGKLIKQERGYDIVSLDTGGNQNGYFYVENNNDLI